MKQTRMLRIACAAALLAIPMMAWAQTPTPAETPSETPSPAATPAATPAAPNVTTGATKLKIGGNLFALYSYDLSDGAKGKNQFDITRAYVNVMPVFSDEYDARITPDITRQAAAAGTNGSTNTTGSLIARLKYAYLVDHRGPVDFTVGLQPTCFVVFEEDIWQYRVLAPIALDQFYASTSADFGFSARAKLLDKRLDVHAAIYNGEYFQKPETNKYKELQTRVTYAILPAGKDPGLRVTGYGSYALKAQDADKVRLIGMVSYESALFNAAGEYIYAQDGNGAGKHVVGGGPSVFGFVNLPVNVKDLAGIRVLARVDVVDPDSKTKKDGSNRIMAGVAFRGTKMTQMVLDYQQIDPEASGVKSSQVLFAHWEAKF